ncbi:MAG: nitroreductase family protein [Promethearchaeota archaeon]|nr:MAG: nitroreductase family protein [Candidatus Lokiarchaeota archaeon]
MNEVLKVIKNRCSVRAYKAKPISQKKIDVIINGAIRAPTACNMMQYSILEVKDQEMKEKLVKTCDNQSHIAKAPLVLIFLADVQRWQDYYRISKVPEKCKELNQIYRAPAESDLMLACCDALIAAQNAVITAESMGIGSCYIADIMENIEIHREMFNLPKWVFPIAMLCFGYPKQDLSKRILTSRFPKKFIHFTDNYKRLNKEDFFEMFKHIKKESLANNAENIGQDYYLQKTGADFSYEMSRSVKVAIQDWIRKD